MVIAEPILQHIPALFSINFFLNMVLWRPTERINECEDSQEYTDLLKGF
jgi:hypothetical protein